MPHRTGPALVIAPAEKVPSVLPDDLKRELCRLLAQILVEDTRAYPTLPQGDNEPRVTFPRVRNPSQPAGQEEKE